MSMPCPADLAEVIGRDEYELHLIGEARAVIEAVAALPTRDVESVAAAVDRIVGDDVDDITFSTIVTALTQPDPLTRCAVCRSPMYADQARCGLCEWDALPEGETR